jgi:hypothetical protein
MTSGNADGLPLSGDDGELVDRLLWVMDHDSGGEEWWFNLAVFVSQWLGVALERDGGWVAPWRVEGEEPSEVHEQWVAAMRDQFEELLAAGVDEEFLVVAVRDALARKVHGYTDFARANENRSNTLEGFQKLIDDPIERQRYRETLEETNPEYAAMSDDELVAQLTGMLERLPVFRPIDADEAAHAWGDSERWADLVGQAISDEIVSTWTSRASRRLSS